METAEVIKRGETCIETLLHRSLAGLSIDVKVHPGVEEFFRLRSVGEQVAVSTIGRHWTPTDKTKPLMAYGYHALESLRSDDGATISVDRLGSPIIETKNNGEVIVNISFLRLVGASEGAGIRFNINGVYSDKYLRTMREYLGNAQKKFYIEYLRPIDMRVTILTADLVV